MRGELNLVGIANLVSYVAGFTTHVQRCVTTAIFRDIQALGMASEAEVFAFVSGARLYQLIFVVGLMWVVTLDAVANSRTVNFTLCVGGVLVCVTGQAERARCTGR